MSLPGPLVGPGDLVVMVPPLDKTHSRWLFRDIEVLRDSFTGTDVQGAVEVNAASGPHIVVAVEATYETFAYLLLVPGGLAWSPTDFWLPA